MTTSDSLGGLPPPASGRRTLRRSRTDRVAAGVSSGLGDYFGVDPVLFRVLFATSAFFAGAGILAYLLAWAAIPEAGTERAPIDGWVGALRRRHVPVWIAALVAGLFLWFVSFSWWAPGPVFPVIVVVVLLIVLFGRREMQARTKAAPAGSDAPAPVNLVKDDTSELATPGWVGEARAWFDEAREAARRRRKRSLPIRIGILGGLAAVLITLGIIDAVSRVQLQVYFWSVLTVVVLGLLVGAVLRRLPFSMIPLLAPAIVGSIAFAGSHTTLHDGIGQREWKPTATPAAQYRVAFGQGILDLRHLPAQTEARTIRITGGAGQIKIIAPPTLNLTVRANIHLGQLSVGPTARGHHGNGGIGITRTVDPPAGATGVPITVDVHLADGNITVDRR
jgi:phage shock protein PspC (stress-responsive transcriptional regulator)